MAEARDLLNSMTSSGFSCDQGRNTTVDVGSAFYLSSETRSSDSEETAGTSLITLAFWSVRNTT
jgi:hypothetical protein